VRSGAKDLRYHKEKIVAGESGKYGWRAESSPKSQDRRRSLGTAQINYSNLQINNGRIIYNNERFIILIFTCQGFECAFVRDLRVYLAERMW
jgi:hypothetical protein